jgi:ATP-dependent DNA helicase RecQ
VTVCPAVREGKYGLLMTTKLDRTLSLARDRFGYASFLPGQREAIASVVEGKDTLVVMPTGSGKSAIYQVAGVVMEGPTVIVSPLIALQRDQAESLEEAQVAEAATLNSTLTDKQRDEVIERLLSGRLEYLFLAPEQLANGETIELLSEARVSLFAVDEAHCISAWGHDFRPDYLRLGAVREEIGGPPALAMTATASPVVREEIVERLRMSQPNILVRGFDRPNICLEVRRFADERAKHDALVEFVDRARKPGIVYVARKRTAEELAGAMWQHGVQAVYYHGGMTKTEREKAQQAFMDDEFEVVVATTAFGMGIDKPNVRFVAHYDIADSIDSHYQEIGRAGRDGEGAHGILFYRAEDLGIRRFFAGNGQVDVEQLESVAEAVVDESNAIDPAEIKKRTGLSDSKLTTSLSLLERTGLVEMDATGTVEASDEELSPEEAAREAKKAAEVRSRLEESRLDMIRAYAETSGCRREFLLNYFGEPYDAPCGNCDNCIEGAVVDDETPRVFELNARVRHDEWGEGMVVRHEEDKITVLFDEAGYKTLSAEMVRERDLLTEV